MTEVNDPAPHPHATEEEVKAAFGDPKLANVLYHDWEAGTYDEKWSISYDERCITYATDVFRAVAGEEDSPYPTAMELGSGTGFFLLNLMQGGVIKKGSVTDLSPGMVQVALRNAENLGLDVDGRVADAERIPYPDDSFDLVVGHAVLHHIPDVPAAFREVLRVLKPGGRFVFAGEPTKIGNFYARKLGQLTWWLTTNVTKLPALSDWRRPQEELDESSRAAALEAVVDLHTFDPSELERMALGAGAVDVRAVTEEFAAALAGWPIRTFEAAVPQEKLTVKWRLFAYHLWLRLSAVDKKLLAKVLPRQLFYNVMIAGTKPPAATGL
ncbi:class I SAM-dependent methyltransferase [Amycolatopsis magusensis]|uniref:Ubiquinone/menaquinone biosynthesis C-methylase UbiE n=1 Tax=Amycolatopsis magusensis TaxID=882444 RepID=A0ABS4Q7X1_9PSEU|nr:class I SAM-dependent methyltransferase [Amycolatopsis magusensis]MBP2186821.1 ubiquinone/menaquinone biosynthesis C-methylase UbiE [Amycolatopsis magusensis]MDI5978327.1 class I SAM-dependent methyltransferase [Amycolatopsis magusensis]UJW35631.1 class I SAM-dependent methyltransferase [Saccharothrix sp. AJ9571]